MLLMVAALMGLVREREASVEVILVGSAGQFSGNPYDYSLLFPKQRKLFDLRMTSDVAMYRGQSADGRWLYFEAFDPTGHSSVYRTRVNGRQRETISETTSLRTMVWSEDREWIYFLQIQSLDLWRVRADGRDAQNLTGGQGIYVAGDWARPPVIENGEWLYFNATTISMSPVSGVYRIRTDGTGLQLLSGQLSEDVQLVYVSPDDTWLIVASDVSVWKITLDQRQPDLLFEGIAGDYIFVDTIVLPKTGVLVAGNGQKLYVIRLADGVVLWQGADAAISYSLVTVDLDEAWLYVAAYGNTVAVNAVRLDGKDEHPLPAMDFFTGGWGWTADGEWFVFQAVNQQAQRNEVRRLRADDQTVEVLYPLKVNFNYPQWSPDGKWIYFSDGWVSSGRTDLYRMRPDGSDLQNLTAGTPLNGTQFIDDMGSIERDWSHGFLTAVGAGFLLVGILFRERQRSHGSRLGCGA